MPFDSDSAKRAARKRWDSHPGELRNPARKRETEIAKAKADYGQLSNYGLYRQTGYVTREYQHNLRGRRASEVWREMTNDPTIGSMLFAIDKILRRVEWTVEPCASQDNGEVSESDVEQADFLQTCMDDLSHSWESFIADALTFLPFGFSFMEIVYKTRESTDLNTPANKRTRYPDGKVGWRKFVLAPQETITDWELDDFGGIQAAVQQTGWGSQTRIPIDKAMLFRTDYRSPTGTSWLRAAYAPWYTKKHLERIEAIGIERDLAGLPVIYADGDYYQRHETTLKDIIRNIRVDEQMGVTLPVAYDEHGNPSVKLELLGSPGTKTFNTSEIIGRYKRDIFNTLLMGLILLGQEKVGTQALASEQRDLSDTVLQSCLNEIACVLNDFAVPRLFQLNGEPLDHLPKVCPGELRPTDVNEFAVALKDAAAAGFMLAGDPEVEAEVRRRLGLPAMPPEMAQHMQTAILEETPNSAAGEPAPPGDMSQAAADRAEAHRQALEAGPDVGEDDED